MKLLRITALVITIALGGYAQAATLNDAIEKPYAAPEFEGLAGWLNSPTLTMGALKGKVVLVDFWTYSCINCIRTLPYINQWHEKYHDKGLVVIGVHTPEFEFEKSEENVKAALVKYGIHYPVALDSHLAVWNAYANHYWPAHYLIDQKGNVVSTHFGEGHYAETEQNIRTLLGLPHEEAIKPDPNVSSNTQTPETYLGSARAASYGGKLPLKEGKGSYQFPVFLPLHHWALQGDWAVESEKITATSANASLRINFQAKQVFLVLGSATGKPVHAALHVNGQPLSDLAGNDIHDSKLTISNHRLYTLVSQKALQNSLLEITADEPGLEAYAFTFGS